MESLLGPRGEVPEEGEPEQGGEVDPGLANEGVEEAGMTGASLTCQMWAIYLETENSQMELKVHS